MPTSKVGSLAAGVATVFLPTVAYHLNHRSGNTVLCLHISSSQVFGRYLYMSKLLTPLGSLAAYRQV